MSEFSRKLKAAMDAKGFQAQDVARLIGVTPSAVSQWVTGTTHPRRDKILKLAKLLEVMPEQLSGIPVPREIAESHLLQPIPVAAEYRRDLPVYAAAEAGGGAMIISQSAIEYTYRSETSRGPDCFAVHVLGDSLEPAFFQGEQVIVDPRRVPAAGDVCIFVAGALDGEWRAVLKQLLRVTPEKWLVRQYNPARDYSLARSEWTRALKVIEKRFR